MVLEVCDEDVPTRIQGDFLRVVQQRVHSQYAIFVKALCACPSNCAYQAGVLRYFTDTAIVVSGNIYVTRWVHCNTAWITNEGSDCSDAIPVYVTIPSGHGTDDACGRGNFSDPAIACIRDEDIT